MRKRGYIDDTEIRINPASITQRQHSEEGGFTLLLQKSVALSIQGCLVRILSGTLGGGRSVVCEKALTEGSHRQRWTVLQGRIQEVDGHGLHRVGARTARRHVVMVVAEGPL